jgi:hypothetical protein
MILERNVLLAAFALAAGTAAHAQQLQVIYCKAPASPKSVVPGALDLAGAPEATHFRALEDLYLSPDGTRWVLKGRTQQGSDEETILIMGSGNSGTMFAQEGQPIPTGAAGELFDFFSSAGASFNSFNHFAYAARARGGVSSVFQKVLLWDGSTTAIVAKMGDPYTGLVDIPANPSGDEIAGNSIGNVTVLDDGRIGVQDSTIGNISTTRRPAIFYDMVAFQQSNVSTVVDLAGTGTETWATIDSGGFRTTPDGQHWIAEGDVVGLSTANDVVVVDGRVVLQESIAVAGGTLLLGAISQSNLAANGDWFARGRDSSSTSASAPDWAVRSGALVAATGDALGGGESCGDTFWAFTGNAQGDWVLGCNTDSADPAADEVIVWNGVVVAREGDPVDLDGNGQFDDGAFLGRGNNTLSAFQADDLRLADDNTLYFLASLNDGAGNDLNVSPAFGTPDALIRIDLDPCTPVVYCTPGTTTNGCVPSISGTGTPSGTAGSGFTIAVAGVEGQKSGLIFYGINGPNSIAWSGTSTSFLCVKTPTQRTPAQASGGTAGACDGALAIDWNAYVATNPGALGTPFAGGETVWSQAWFRDPPASKTTNLSAGLRFQICP